MKGTNWFSRNFKTIIYVAFLVPIITVAIVSISHVTGWYGISNPMSWALYLSIGIEIAALSALAAISVNMGSKVYVPFGIVTLIQFVGNIFFAFEYIDITSTQFLSWVDLTGPILEYVGVEQGNLQSHRRFLAIFSGGMLPLISLSFLHMLVRFNEERRLTSKSESEDSKPKEEPIQASDLVGEIARYRPTTDELDKLNEILSKTKEEPKSEHYYDTERNKTPEPPTWLNDGPPPTEDDFSHYSPRNGSEMMITSDEDIINSIPEDDDISDWDVTLSDGFDEDHALDMAMNDMVKDMDIQDFENLDIDDDTNEIVVNEPEIVQPEKESIEIKQDDFNIVIPPPSPTEEIKNIDVVLDDLPNNEPKFNVDVVVERIKEEPKEVLPSTPVPNFVYKEPIEEETTDIVNDDPEKKK